jgi:chemotaxis protein methyltransferase CheR
VENAECVAFLRWSLPRLQLRWEGFRKVRRQVCRRIQRRLHELGLPDAEGYRAYLATHPEEWLWLDTACRIPISRFYRNRGAFESLAEKVLPLLARRVEEAGEGELRCWSAGCASGEEPYSLALIWALRLQSQFPGLSLRILATDVDAHLLARARSAEYGASSLKDLPGDWVERAFERSNSLFCLRSEFRRDVEFRLEDIRKQSPGERFHLILCRNMAFTYFADAPQERVAALLRESLEPGGILMLGSHEELPVAVRGLSALAGHAGIYQKL